MTIHSSTLPFASPSLNAHLIVWLHLKYCSRSNTDISFFCRLGNIAPKVQGGDTQCKLHPIIGTDLELHYFFHALVQMEELLKMVKKEIFLVVFRQASPGCSLPPEAMKEKLWRRLHSYSPEWLTENLIFA